MLINIGAQQVRKMSTFYFGTNLTSTRLYIFFINNSFVFIETYLDKIITDFKIINVILNKYLIFYSSNSFN